MTPAVIASPPSSRRLAYVNKLGFILRVCFTFCIAGAISSLTAASDLTQQFDDIIRSEIARQNLPGIAVAVLQHGTVVFSRAYGMANVEHDVPVTPDTIFQSGSVGKQFTAALVMHLIETGKFELEDSINRFFPEAPDTWRSITIRHLLTHTSGLPNYEGADFDLQRNYSEAELIQRAMHLDLIFPPGARWSYSNTGYMLLGMIAQRVTGRSFGELLRDELFLPSGMGTARIVSDSDIVPHRAGGYTLVDGKLKNQDWVAPTLNKTGDGCVYLSLNDFIAWDYVWRDGRLLSKESWAMIRSPVSLNSGKTYPYGFGINLFEEDGQRVERHSGGWQGFKAYRSYYVTDDFSVLVLANLAQCTPYRIADELAGLLKAKHIGRPVSPPKEDPRITKQLIRLLNEARDNHLSPKELSYVDSDFFPNTAARMASQLANATSAENVRLTDQWELGDDAIYRYEISWGGHQYIVRRGMAPDGKVSMFYIN